MVTWRSSFPRVLKQTAKLVTAGTSSVQLKLQPKSCVPAGAVCRLSSIQDTVTRVCRRVPTDPCMRRILARCPVDAAGPPSGSAAAAAHAQPSPSPGHASGCAPTPRRHVVTRGDSPGSSGELSRVRVRVRTGSERAAAVPARHPAAHARQATRKRSPRRQLRPALMRRRPHARQTAGG